MMEDCSNVVCKLIIIIIIIFVIAPLRFSKATYVIMMRATLMASQLAAD